MITTYSRTADLKRAFNDFWQKALKSSKDFYADMNLEDWIGLKKALGNINNIVTLVVTQRFIEYLHHEGIINDAQRKDMEKQVDSTSANANGYDVEYNSGSIKIVAEVKCNIPVKAGSFGSAQEKNIIKDIEKLFSGKSKSKLSPADLEDYYKFMVLLDCGEVRTCMCKLIPKLHKAGYKVEEYTGQPLRKDTVYVVYIKP